MEASTGSAFLRISPSPQEDAPFKDEPLIHRETWLGRRDFNDKRDNLIDLDPHEHVHLKEISRFHATVERVDANTYILRNRKGRLDIGIYETVLKENQMHQLRHTDVFRLPNTSPAYWIQFFIDRKTTTIGDKPLYIYPNISEPIVYVFNQPIKLSTGDFKFINYLYQRRRTICTNEEIIAHLWPGPQSSGRDKGAIEQILVRVRKLFREASGFGFIETVAGTGYKLMV